MSNAPAAPGRLGQPLEVSDALTYLTALGSWITERRAELDQLDQAILASPDRAQLTNDMVLSLSVWQAIKNRYDVLAATWDSGRVGPAEREKLAALIWGRLDDVTPGGQASPGINGLSVSLPEACRLSDALAGQLRSRLQRNPQTDQIIGRIRDVRAQIERVRDQAKLEPPVSQARLMQAVDDMAARAADMAARVDRGADVGGLVGPLEIQAATMERDLIVGNTKRRQAKDTLDRARATRESLVTREADLQGLVAQVVRTVTPAPKYAVPQVEALGPVPSSASQLDGYVAKLTQVSSAMQVVQDAYTRALASHTMLVSELEVQMARAKALGVADDADLSALGSLVGSVLARQPSPVDVARRLMAAYAELAASLGPAGGRA